MFVAGFISVTGEQWAAAGLGFAGLIIVVLGLRLVRGGRRHEPTVTVEQQDGLWKVYEDGVHVESQTVRLHAEASAANRRDPNRQAQRRRQEWASALRDFASIVLSWVVVLCVLALIVAALSAVGGGEDSARSDSPASFCDTHDCIPSFDEGNGSIVQCTDGEWSHSGGIQGACSYHGGVR